MEFNITCGCGSSTYIKDPGSRLGEGPIICQSCLQEYSDELSETLITFYNTYKQCSSHGAKTSDNVHVSFNGYLIRPN